MVLTLSCFISLPLPVFTCFATVPYVIPAQVWQVGQLLHLNDAVVEAGLQTLGHHVGKNDSHHHGQDVRDLACQLEADDGGGDSVAHCSCQSCCTFPRQERSRERRRLSYRNSMSRQPGKLQQWEHVRKKEDMEAHQWQHTLQVRFDKECHQRGCHWEKAMPWFPQWDVQMQHLKNITDSYGINI